ncbi:uncharacterized protein Eint_080860 [Encephalitozoon intestinalis ATCC 50506]|uniref:Uncharacterized protein n=1 Tax=Encephalitozoon intestinalis (strain ATCC 50506) TaxID=876142 RepID=E0S8N7_ENCIT|nr:uncharacterized protein Eint_080860 [Encephalitozoon intestinalis ATCC 50506]ADM12020.1 hypothetical protein Eint_080860 [Encephalitozoon intestinalis ATCC 50506]UTX45808.1 hypothetical protein GPK93_08g13850 [Encephalitozoon intestinalis]
MLPINFMEICSTKPNDFVFDKTICTKESRTPRILQEYSKEEKACVLRRRILALASRKGGWPQKKALKRESESMWDVDLTRSDQGHFDQRGNFVLGAAPSLSFMWLVRRGEDIQGPFTDREMREKINTQELKNTQVRRDIDKGFVSYDSLAADLGDFLSSEKLDEYFESHAAVKKPLEKPQEFFEDLSSLSLKKHPKKDLDRSKILEACVKSKNFLHSRNPSVTLGSMERRISGKSFSEAVKIISHASGLSKTECEEFLNLFLDESKLSILSDICPDGFVKVTPVTRKGSRRK